MEIHMESLCFFLLGAWLVSVIVIDVGNNKGTELCLWYGKVIGLATIYIDVFSLGKYYVTELGSTDGIVEGEFGVLLLGASIGYLYGLEIR